MIHRYSWRQCFGRTVWTVFSLNVALACSTAESSAVEAGDVSSSGLDATHDGGLESTVACVPKHVVQPSADESTALMTMLATAAADPEVDGVSGKQGRVYLPAGLHRFNDVVVPSNVRIEVDPGATLTAMERAPTGINGENPLFTLGPETEVHNITITAGDGCGGAGTPTLANKLHDTGDRGNTETNGMSNMAVPHNARWPVATFFVFDMDPKFRNVPSDTFAVRLGWATNVTVSRFFSIQNAERVTDAQGIGTGPTVNYARNPVIKPRANSGSTFEAPRMPTRFHLEWVYNVLSPSGWGPVQVQSCAECTFEHIFSHGGVALRMETDNAAPLCGHDVCGGGCTRNDAVMPPVDDQGHGLTAYARIDKLEANDIEVALGNVGVTLSPHCQHNGRVHVKNVRGSSSSALVTVGEGGATNGIFDSESLIENVVGTKDVQGKAQEAKPQQDTYDLGVPKVALSWTPTTYTARTAGTFCWPDTLVDIRMTAGAQKPNPMPVFTHANCSAP